MDEKTTEQLAASILDLYKKADIITDTFNKHCVKKFKKGVIEIFGDDQTRKPSAEQLSTLMLDVKYGFKDATDAINREQKNEDPKLYKTGRSGEVFQEEKGRRGGRKRKNSFSNFDAGITDRVNRDDTTRDFFATKTEHAKGLLEGDEGGKINDENRKIYQQFQDADAPFIGGASGTMQGLIMGMEMKKKKSDLDEDELEQREKLIGVYMATLINGGHHSASECLIAAQKYEYFKDVTDPLKNYTTAMRQLGDRLSDVGLPTDLTAKVTAVGDPWRSKVKQLITQMDTLQNQISRAYADRGLDAAPLIDEFKKTVRKPAIDLFGMDLADTLDGLPATKDDATARGKLLATARGQIGTLKANLKDDLVDELENNPFKPLTLKAPLGGVLDMLLNSVVGPA